MNPRSGGSAWREFFVQQLVSFGDEKSRFLDAYFPDYTAMRIGADQLLSDYTGLLESLLSKRDEGLCEQVLIGSRVDITYLDDASTETLILASPHEVHSVETGTGAYRVSFLSPMGKSLLMKHSQDQTLVDTPSGKLRVRIDSISLSEDALGAGTEREYLSS